MRNTLPIMGSWDDRLIVPWTMVAGHGAQALKNHRQTLDELASRGGLSPCEALAVLEDRPWRPMPPSQAIEQLKAKVSAWQAGVNAKQP